ncbi:hypothetical protein SAMN05421509_1215 [Chromohalobacter canadensis]|uniref:Uncharacterized protein n=1 Tax=Chromohalobacter canadensis TaxID=141389 RepID=A0A285VWE2_9GAMM|nr:hypothetical protein SAMN05421509_1215 [Chromohalobacter canadensis]
MKRVRVCFFDDFLIRKGGEGAQDRNFVGKRIKDLAVRFSMLNNMENRRSFLPGLIKQKLSILKSLFAGSFQGQCPIQILILIINQDERTFLPVSDFIWGTSHVKQGHW